MTVLLMATFERQVQTAILAMLSTETLQNSKSFSSVEGIIQKKSASGSRTLPFVIFDKKMPFFPKMVLF